MIEVIIKKFKKFISRFGTGKYVLYYSRKGKLLWYCIPKAASRTIKFHIEVKYSDFTKLGEVPLTKWLWRGYTKFVVLRDDRERRESAYRDKVLNRKVWDEKFYFKQLELNPYNQDIHIKPCRLLFDTDFVDIIVRVDEIQYLLEKLNIPYNRIEWINKTK